MESKRLSRRQFLTGAAVVAGAAALPGITNIASAVATPATGFPGTMTPWVPLDATLAARKGYEIYRGKHQFQSG
jgi:hypothetical protein